MTFLDSFGSVIKLVFTLFAAIRGGYQSIRGKAPQMNFEPTQTGIALRVKNTRPGSIIVESIEASPQLLGFSSGDSVEEIAQAVMAQRKIPRERPLMVLRSGQSELVITMAFDPFEKSEPGLPIKVTMRWRDAERGWFSESRVKHKITVKDVRDLQEAKKKQYQMFFV
jgi:hypothetical protein